MGISGLLPLLKSIQVNTHISEFSGKTLAVDGYVWLHRGVYTCTAQLLKGEPTAKYVDYFMHRTRMLRHHGVEPYFVFDGGPLPAKKGTEAERAKTRAENLAKANALVEQGQHSQARELFSRCVDVSPEMAYQVIKALKAENVSYVVAPYEADSQMTFLERRGIVQGVITEDSDLLVFGCKLVIYKLDSDGHCVAIKREHLGHVKEAPMVGWSDKEFREMAILAGCDYLPSIPGLGVKTAHKFLRKYKTVEKVLQYIRLESNLKIPAGYLQALRQAELPFLHQRVYDPETKSIVPLTPIPDGTSWDESKDAYVGSHYDDKIAQGIAEGSLDPATLEPIKDIHPAFNPSAPSSRRASKGKVLKAPSSDNGQTLTNFFTILPKSQSRPSSSQVKVLKPTQPRTIGAASGSRTLSGQMETERERKKQRETVVLDDEEEEEAPVLTTSKFFGGGLASKRKRTEEDTHHRSPQRPRLSVSQEDKENSIPFVDPVEQEDGYRSPGCSSVVDVSSPIERLSIADDMDRGSPTKRSMSAPPDHVSSPVVEFPSRRSLVPPFAGSSTSGQGVSVLVLGTPSPLKPEDAGVDLRDGFCDASSDEPDQSFEDPPGPDTPVEGGNWDDKVDFNVDVHFDEEVQDIFESEAQKVMIGWRNKWSHVNRRDKPASPTVNLDLDDTFGVGASTSTPTQGPRAIQFSSASASDANRFKRRRPLALQAQAPRRSLANELPKVPSKRLSLDSSSGPRLSQRLDQFRQVWNSHG